MWSLKKRTESHIRLQIDILRRKSAESKSYIQSIIYETDDMSATVASALSDINSSETLDIHGDLAGEICWECSCLQKKCGACAMVIDGRPGLACAYRLKDHRSKKPLRLSPLSKFPVVADLMVDRSVLFDNLKTFGMWAGTGTVRNKFSDSLPGGESGSIGSHGAEADTEAEAGFTDMDGKTGISKHSLKESNQAKSQDAGTGIESVSPGHISGGDNPSASSFEAADEGGKSFSHLSRIIKADEDEAYEASRCLQCGCCLEVCPNFCPGDEFFGPAAFVPALRLLASMPDEDRERIYASYMRHSYEGCGKSLACQSICPAGIDTDHMLVRLNLLDPFRK